MDLGNWKEVVWIFFFLFFFFMRIAGRKFDNILFGRLINFVFLFLGVTLYVKFRRYPSTSHDAV